MTQQTHPITIPPGGDKEKITGERAKRGKFYNEDLVS